ncbi:MAG: tetratricopeptide repeat protein [Bacteroidia bacterium]
MMKNKFVSCIILFATAFIFYGNSISNQFALDDLIVITGNQFTQKGFAGLKDIFTHDAFVGAYGEALNLSGGRYRPFSIAMFAIEKQMFGYTPQVFHFFNVFFFGITVVVLFLFLCRLFSKYNYTLPFLAALLFAIHPIHTEVVANIKSCDEIFALLFSLLTFYLLLPKTEKKIEVKTNSRSNKKEVSKGQKAKGNATVLSESTTSNIGHTERSRSAQTANLITASLLFFIALLSKENAITFIALIPLGLWMFTNDSIKTIAIKTAPLIVVSVIYILMRAKFAGIVGDRVTTDIMDDSYMRATMMEKLATITQVQLRYLVLMIFPYQLSYDYSYNQIPLVNWSNPFALLSLVIHLGALVFAVMNIGKQKIISYSIIIYFITFSIVSNLVFNIGTSMAERFTYMPTFGFCILLAYGLLKLLKFDLTGNEKLKPLAIGITAVIVLVAATQTIPRNKDWKDNYTLYKADVNKVPNSARARLYYGIECIGQYQKSKDVNDINEAITQIKKSTEINPDFHFAWHNLGVAYQNINKWTESIDCYEHVLKLQPLNEQALYGLGLAYGKGLNQPDKAIPYFKKILFEVKSTKPDYYEGLGLCYAVKGDYDSALNYFKQGINANPDAGKLYYNAAITYANKGVKDSSDIFFKQAFDLDPTLKK